MYGAKMLHHDGPCTDEEDVVAKVPLDITELRNVRTVRITACCCTNGQVFIQSWLPDHPTLSRIFPSFSQNDSLSSGYPNRNSGIHC